MPLSVARGSSYAEVQELVRRLDPLLVEAVDDVDMTLIALAQSWSPRERLVNAYNAARSLAELRNAASGRR